MCQVYYRRRHSWGLTRLAIAGFGSPSGFHDTKTRMLPTSKIPPKPLKRYPSISKNRLDFGGEGAFRPYSACRLWTCSLERPVCAEVVSREGTSAAAIVCHSRSLRSVLIRVRRCNSEARVTTCLLQWLLRHEQLQYGPCLWTLQYETT